MLLLALGSGLADADDPALQCRQLRVGDPAAAIEVCAKAAQVAIAQQRIDAAEDLLFQLSDAQLATGARSAAGATLDRVELLPVTVDPGKREFRLHRRRGILAYREDHFAQALNQFRAALDVARDNQDLLGQAQAQNDLGNGLRRIGDYRAALEAYRASLQIKRRVGDPQLGPLLNNLGDLYQDLAEPEQAMQYYREAMAAHAAAGRPIEAAHTRESLAALMAADGLPDRARVELETALATYAAAGVVPGQLRVLTQLAHDDRLRDDHAAARKWLDRGFALAGDGPVPVALLIEHAHSLRQSKDATSALSVLQEAVRRLGPDDVDRIEIERELATTFEQLSDPVAALAAWRRFQAADAQKRTRDHDGALNQLRIRFEVAEKDRSIQTLRAQQQLQDAALERGRLMLWLTVLAAATGLALLALVLQRRKQQWRIDLARHDAMRTADLEQFRRATAALSQDSDRLRALLDTSAEPIMALDSHATVIHANAAAACVLSQETVGLTGRTAIELFGSEGGSSLLNTLTELEDSDSPSDLILNLPPGNDQQILRVRLQASRDGEFVIAFLARGIADPALSSVDRAALERGVSSIDQAREKISADARNRFRVELVELMLHTLQAWESSTGTTRIELAEKSRLWRVTIDDGRLRVRAMERYLALPKLPRHPRWRDVLRSAYFVLSQCELDSAARDSLRQRCDGLHQLVRDRAVLAPGES